MPRRTAAAAGGDQAMELWLALRSYRTAHPCTHAGVCDTRMQAIEAERDWLHAAEKQLDALVTSPNSAHAAPARSPVPTLTTTSNVPVTPPQP